MNLHNIDNLNDNNVRNSDINSIFNKSNDSYDNITIIL